MSALKLRLLGAADTVTGSRHLVEYCGKKILIDCGLFQGPKEVRMRNWDSFPIEAHSIECVILTHAHLDHSGFLPRLVKEGFKGRVLCSKGTWELCQVLLKDAAYLEEEFAKFANKTQYSNHKPALPLFTEEDVENALALFESHERNEWIELSDQVQVQLIRAGHIPGASMVQFSLAGHKPQRITFSGDVGNDRLTTMRAPEGFPPSEVLVLESTYGDRLQNRKSVMPQLAEIINRTVKRKGVVVIPAFAVGRSQEVIYLIKQLETQKLIPPIPVVLDSPMSIQATRTFLSHPEDHALDVVVKESEDIFHPSQFETCSSTDESMLCTMRDGPMVVISAAGMLNGGRILHHLKKRLPDSKNAIVFTGYQAEGTKGRFLQERAKDEGVIRIHHEEIPIEAEITTLESLSSHADYHDLLGMIERCRVKPRLIVLCHGSPHAQASLAEMIHKNFGIPVVCSNEQRTLFPFLSDPLKSA